MRENNIKFTLFILILTFFFVFPAVAAPPEAHLASIEQVLEAVQKKYDTTSDISATFTQETYSSSDSEPVIATGRVYFRRGGKMRWEYEKPERQLIVTHNNEVYIYEKDAEQVMIIPRKRFLSSEVCRAFFFGRGTITNFFNVSSDEECRLSAERWCVILTPRKDSGNLKEMRLVIDPETHVIQEMWITDELSSRTHIRFRNIELNKNLQDSLFTFKVPKGVEVYRAE